jgi:hypothetical protein
MKSSARMQYPAITFSALTFEAIYRPSVSVRRAFDDPAGLSGPVKSTKLTAAHDPGRAGS